MNDFTSPAAGDADASYAAALQAAMDAPTPQARVKAVDALEALAKQRAEPTAPGASVPAGEPQEGFEAPASALAYQFEQTLPPGVEIVDTASLGALKGSLAQAGVPAAIGNAAFGDIARIANDGGFASEAAYVEACRMCRSQIERVHGEGAEGLIADALSWIEDAVRANPALEEAAAFAMASPLALQAAANMKRFGRARR